MSASFSAAWWRASGWFSTLIASAGREGTFPAGTASPVSGHVGTGGPTSSPTIPTVCRVLRTNAGACCGNRAKYPSTPVAATETVAVAATSLPLRESALRRWRDRWGVAGMSSLQRSRAVCEGLPGPCAGGADKARAGTGMLPANQRGLNDPRSHLLESPDALGDRRMRVEDLLQRPHPLALDAGGLVEPQVRRCVVGGTHGDHGARGDLAERARKAGRVPREQRALRVRQVLAVARDGEAYQLPDDRRQDQEHESDGEDDRARPPTGVLPTSLAPSAPPPRAHEELADQHDGSDQRGDDRPDEDVTVHDVRELVADHALELDPVQPLEQPLGHGNGGVLGIAARRERVQGPLGDHVHLRLGDPRGDRQSLDDVL